MAAIPVQADVATAVPPADVALNAGRDRFGPHASATMLDVRALTKRFGSNHALAGISFSLFGGTLNFLLGPNGAGKSTLFQIVTGLYAPDAGAVEIAGHDLRRAGVAALRHLGIVFQQGALDADLTVRRNLQWHADLHGMARAYARDRIATCSALLGIAELLGQPVRELSGGTRRKVELARAVLHQPALLLLDEPTVGLDPAARADLMRAVRDDVRTRGACVLWATHWTEEVQAADRVLILHRGRLLADGRRGDVVHALGGGTLEAAFMRATAAPARADPPTLPPL
jgi:ABC-2 type transport system ATP-binding protein